MAALDYQQHTRKHGFIHDTLPLLLVAVVCFLVVALDIHV